MKNRIFTGAGVAIVTPMSPDGSVNYSKLGEMIDYQIANSTDAIIVCGTTGESSTLSHEEHLKTIQYTVQHTDGRIPVIAGTGSNDTAYAIELSQEAEKASVDGLLLVSPYYNKTSQRGLVAHFTAIADSVNIPIILYNIPGRTGINIQPATMKELSKHERIVAVKEASNDISSIAEIKALCGNDLDVYSGNDDQIVPIMSLGGIGVVSVLSNIMPRETHNICQLYLEGKVKESAALQLQLMDIAKALFIDVNPIPVKQAMNLLGMDVGECRLPLLKMSESQIEALKNVLKAKELL